MHSLVMVGNNSDGAMVKQYFDLLSQRGLMAPSN